MQKAFLEPVLQEVLKGNTWLDLFNSDTSSAKPENVATILWIQDLRLICRTSNQIVTKWFEENWKTICWAQIFNKFVPYYKIPNGKLVAQNYFTELMSYQFLLDRKGYNRGRDFYITTMTAHESYRMFVEKNKLVVEYDELSLSWDGHGENDERYTTTINMIDGTNSLQVEEILYPHTSLDNMTDSNPRNIFPEDSPSELQPYLHLLLLPHLATVENLKGLIPFYYGIYEESDVKNYLPNYFVRQPLEIYVLEN